MPRTGSSSRPFAPAIALATVLVAGCGTVTPSASPGLATPGTEASPTPTSGAPSGGAPSASARPAAEVYAEIRAAVEALRGLAPTASVEPVTLDEAALRASLEAEFDRENTADELGLSEDLLITLGLLPSGANLRDILLDFQSGQVVGFYTPDKDQLFVISRSGGVGAMEKVTYAHEFTHQLQDQHVDLESFGLDATDQSDIQIARLALIEGDAVSVQTSWMTANLTPTEIGEVLQAALDPQAVAALTRAPAFVRETALFPYEDGFAFVSGLLAGGGYANVDAAFADPPASTEQIIHPEKYEAREAPVAVTLPAVATALGAGWSAAGQDTLGELILGIWLRAGGVPRPDSLAAAAGWGGDRLVILRGPEGAVGVGVTTAWDTAADAAAFQAAAATAMATLDPGGQVVSDGLRRVYLAMGDRAADILTALTR
jgi:hypothetical protein